MERKIDMSEGVETKNYLASSVLLSKEFTKGENSPLEIIESHKTFYYNWWTIISWELVGDNASKNEGK